ncbi:MAG: hypothetical protein K2Q18_15555, partial [Bdellovibrionales bacterium]|nr:hypothetical protein [Bdellovibrionales bacterium]
FGNRPDANNFHKYWTEIPVDERNQMPKRSYGSAFDPILTPKLLSDFYLNKAQLADRLSFMEIQTLMNAYPYKDFHQILAPLHGLISRKNVRLETQMKALIGEDKIPAEVLNVSKEGILLRIMKDKPLVQGQNSKITVWLNRESSTNLTIEARWCPAKNGLFGCLILETSNEWNEMIAALEADYKKQSGNIKAAA